MSSDHLETALLRTFIAVAEAGGFSKASHLLSLTQPTISLRIKRLEDQCGTQLFQRQGQGALLTEEGSQLLRYARRIVSLHDEAWTAVTAQGISGALRLGLIPDLSLQPITKALYSFARAHPEVRLEVTEGTSAEMGEALAEGRLDMALMLGEESVSTPLYRTEQISWVASRNFRWQDDEPLPLVLCPEPCRFREMAFSRLDEAGIEWRLAFTSQSLSVTKEAVETGLGVTVRGDSLCGNNLVSCGRSLGLPVLPTFDIVLHRSAKSGNLESIQALSDLILTRASLEVVEV